MNWKLKQKILNLLFPVDCVGCGREDVWLCEDCLLKLPLRKNTGCFFCGKTNSSGVTCSICAANHSLDGVFICANYDDKLISELIKKLKYSFARELGEVLGKIAVRYWKELSAENKLDKTNWQEFIVTPIPLHKKRLAWRGFNQAETITRYLAAQFSLPYQDLLVRVKNNAPQAKLSGAERQKNIKDCFQCLNNDLTGKNILLIDDVATTGSTLDEAARILKTADAKNVWGLVIAKG